MFTGLVQRVGTVAELSPTDRGARLVVDLGGWSHAPSPGDSISVSGCCLTVAGGVEGGRAAFDVVTETLARTTLGDRRPGDRVNLEHAVRADTLMGGHFVQGHVDALGDVVGVRDDPEDWRLEVAPGPDAMPCVAPKGSITIEGVSLTIASVGGDRFDVALIPTTLELTTLGSLRAGDRVNLETDIIARTVVSYLERTRAGG